MSSEVDLAFLDTISSRLLNDFRDETFSSDFISDNAQIFLNHKWINVPKLKEFMRRKEQPSHVRIKDEIETSGRTRLSITPVVNTIVKKPLFPPAGIKKEPNLDKRNLYHGDKQARANDSEVILISSDSDSGRKPTVKKEDVRVKLEGSKTAKGKGKVRNRVIPVPILSGRAFDQGLFIQESQTVWTDSEMTTFVIEGDLQVTAELWVKRVEYLSEIPYVFPIPKVATAFIVDLHHEKFLIPKSENDPTPRRPDWLIKSKNQDSWRGGSGSSDSTARMCFQPGYERIVCRRSRLLCQGCYACAEVDPELLQVTRNELDPGPRSRIFAAQKATRVAERSSVEQRAAIFLNVCRSKCSAIDDNGRRCAGEPRMKEKTSQEAGRGHRYWVSCGGWRKDFKIGHKTHAIPDDVDESLLAKLMNGSPLDSEETDTNPCSLVVAGHIGLKLKHCPHPHIKDGVSPSLSLIKNYPCQSRLTIFVPMDPTLRFALVVHPDNIPHNHPIPRIAKASFEAKKAYIRCIQVAGTNGALTVQKVDQATSTKILLGGQRPGQFDPALYDDRLKRNMIQGVKGKIYPAGLGHAGVYELYRKDLSKMPADRYIHSFITTPDGGTIAFTCVPSLLALIHEVTSFECDVTFKRVQTLNEWELVIYYPPVQRAVTIARVYIDKAHTDHYRRLFDELQSQILILTGKALGFQRFSEDGNILCMGADMEAAQVLGAAQSILASNDVGYSGINVTSPEELLPYFVRVCLTHSKRGVLDFKPLVSGPDYQRILNFPYMKNEAELLDFTAFIDSLGIKKIKDWWNHKIKSKWIIPCILGSQSKIDPKHWGTTPATTNVGEAQHHWTNKLTGIGLTPVDGIESAHLVDEQAAEEVVACLEHGALKNRQTELFHRQVRGSQRHNAVARKTREAAEIWGSTTTLNARIEEEKEFRHQSLNQQRDYEVALKELPDGDSGGQMGIDHFDERSTLRGKIADEKEKRRKSNAIQKVLLHEKEEITTSATGKPATYSTRTPHLPFKPQKPIPEASSSGRVLPAVSGRVGRAQSESQSFISVENSLKRDESHLGSATGDEWEQAEQFELEDDPEAGWDKISSATHEYEGARSSTSSEPIVPYQEREILHMNYTLNSSTAAEYWNSEPEDSGLPYLDLMRYPSLPSTISGEFSELDNTSTHDVGYPCDTTTSRAGGLSFSSDAENMDTSWPLHSSGASAAPPYNFDFTMSALDQDYGGYPNHDTDSLAHFRFDPIAAMAYSPQPELFLPVPPPVVDSSPPDSPKLVPQDSLRVPDNKRLRISDLTEENILPDHERRKRSKPDRLTL